MHADNRVFPQRNFWNGQIWKGPESHLAKWWAAHVYLHCYLYADWKHTHVYGNIHTCRENMGRAFPLVALEVLNQPAPWIATTQEVGAGSWCSLQWGWLDQGTSHWSQWELSWREVPVWCMLPWPNTSQGNGFQRWCAQGKIRRMKEVNTEVHEQVTENTVSVEGVGNCGAWWYRFLLYWRWKYC